MSSNTFKLLVTAIALCSTIAVAQDQSRPRPRRPGAASTQSSQSGAQSSGQSSNSQSESQTPQRPIANRRVITTGRIRGNTEKPSSDKPLIPVETAPAVNLRIAADTPITVKISQAIDSGHAKNNDSIAGTLAAPVGSFPAGTPVQLVVVAVAKAGQLSSFGELSVQIISIGGRNFLSKTVTAQGKEGHKDLLDSAPDPGTEAALTPDTPLTLPAA